MQLLNPGVGARLVAGGTPVEFVLANAFVWEVVIPFPNDTTLVMMDPNLTSDAADEQLKRRGTCSPTPLAQGLE